MKNLKRNIILSASVLALGISAAPALADKGGHGKGKGKHKVERHHGKHHDDDVVIRIGGDDRVIIRDYLSNNYGRNCPPGLAKKRNGCLPPGIAKKRYRIGYPLDVDYYPLPGHILSQLGPVPYGYQYVRVDKDVLLIGEATKKVVDAITLMSAVGR